MDQFYTKPDVAKKCLVHVQKHLKMQEYDIFLEPSAGKGAFLKLLDKDKRIGIDLDPKDDEIIHQNYFDYTPVPNKKYLVIGNPPFGRVSSTAVKFFNKSAEFCDAIAFIIPRTFKRVSIQNRLNLYFHNIFSEDIPTNPCCFEPAMHAKCCFQIWIRKQEKRQIVSLKETHHDFYFLRFGPKDDNNQPTPPHGADFAIRAYGGNCGEICETNLDQLRPKSWHWIKSNINANILKKRFSCLDFSLSADTVRQNSIGKKELILLYSVKYSE